MNDFLKPVNRGVHCLIVWIPVLVGHTERIFRNFVGPAIQRYVHSACRPFELSFFVFDGWVSIDPGHVGGPNWPGCFSALTKTPLAVMNAAFVAADPGAGNQVVRDSHIPSIRCIISCTSFTANFIILL